MIRLPRLRHRLLKPNEAAYLVSCPEWHFLKREQGRSPDRRGRSNMAEARSKAERGRAPLGTANASSKASTSADIPSAEQGLGLAELLCAHGVYSQPRGFSLCQVLKEGPFVSCPRDPTAPRIRRRRPAAPIPSARAAVPRFVWGPRNPQGEHHGARRADAMIPPPPSTVATDC